MTDNYHHWYHKICFRHFITSWRISLFPSPVVHKNLLQGSFLLLLFGRIMFFSPGQTKHLWSKKTHESQICRDVEFSQFSPTLPNCNLVLTVCISQQDDDRCCDPRFAIFLYCLQGNITCLLCINIMFSVLSACLSEQLKQIFYHGVFPAHPDVLHKAAQLSLISIFCFQTVKHCVLVLLIVCSRHGNSLVH